MEIEELKTLVNNDEFSSKKGFINHFVGSYEPSKKLVDFYENALNIDGFRKQIFYGGYGQGDFWSYSSLVYWKSPRDVVNRKGTAYIKSCCLFLSYLAPVAIISYGDVIWNRRKVLIPEIGFEKKCEISGNHNPHNGWETLDITLREKLKEVNIEVYEHELLSEIDFNGTTLLDGLDFELSGDLLSSLFYSGRDWDY